MSIRSHNVVCIWHDSQKRIYQLRLDDGTYLQLDAIYSRKDILHMGPDTKEYVKVLQISRSTKGDTLTIHTEAIVWHLKSDSWEFLILPDCMLAQADWSCQSITGLTLRSGVDVALLSLMYDSKTVYARNNLSDMSVKSIEAGNSALPADRKAILVEDGRTMYAFPASKALIRKLLEAFS